MTNSDFHRSAGSEHDLYKTGDHGAPDQIKDRNGEVVLGLCRKCGRAEIELSEPCVRLRPDQAWQMVPLPATPEMIAEAERVDAEMRAQGFANAEPEAIYYAMLDAAPSPPIITGVAQSAQVTDPTPLEAAKKLLINASLGSCTCNTKSPELMWHAPNCRYVTIMMALENVEIAAQPPAAPVETETVEGDLDTIVQLIHKHVGIRQRVNVDLTGIEDAAKAILAALRPRSSAGTEDALGYAQRLATILWEKHWKDDAPEWRPLPDVVGVLTQIDNMVAGLSRDVPQTASVRLRPMSEAPKDREIFALHYNRDYYGCADKSRPDAGNFHPIQWKERPWEPNYRPRWGMRWNDEYNVTLNDFAGWVDPADLPSTLSRPHHSPENKE